MVSAGGTRMGPHAFHTPPPRGAEGEEVRVLLFGDSGWGGPQQIDLARQIERADWDLSIHVGDIAYDDGAESEFTERHFRVYASTLASTPFYPAVGNHDVRADGGRSYDGAFLWPEPFAGARYYSFRWGRIRFVSIDTSSNTEDVSDLRDGTGRQLEWLKRVLREASADSTVDWIITLQHHPLYSHAVGISGHGIDQDLRANLLPLYERYGVDLVSAGHDHHYERSWPIRDGRRVNDGCGPVHVLSGGGGASRYARDITNTTLLATAQRVYQYVELTIDSDRIRGRTIDRDGQVVDEFTVRRYDGTTGPLPDRCSG
jgi:3',5'-cyclic AMP phosphodiesterase CpdA